MLCTRCSGLVVVETFCDLREEISRAEFQGSRCLNCGWIEDPVIRANRLHPVPPKGARLAGLVDHGRKVPIWLSARRPESLFGNEP